MGQLKIKPEHVEHIKDAIASRNTPEALEGYRSQGLSDMRFRWDLTYASGLTKWICDNIYPYASDDHLDSVLRQLTNTK